MPSNYTNEPGRWPRHLPYEEGMQPPPGYHVGTRNIGALWITGLTVFSAIYGSTIIASIFVANGDNQAGWLLLPIAGPVAYAGTASGFNNESLIAAMVFVSVGQAAGVGMFIGGLAGHEQTLVRNDVGRLVPGEPILHIGAGNASMILPF